MGIEGQGTGSRIMTCIFCSPTSYYIPLWIDEWWAIEACCYSYSECGSCLWTIFAPLCISGCKIGDTEAGMDHCVTGVKQWFFAWALGVVGIIDGFWNCGNFMIRCVKSGATSFNDVALKDAHFFADKIKNCLSLETSTEGLKVLESYSP